MCKEKDLAPRAFPPARSSFGLANKTIITGGKREAVSKELSFMVQPARVQGVKCNGSTNSQKAMQSSFKIFFPMTWGFSSVPLDSKQWRLPEVKMTCSLQVFANGCTRAPVLCGYQGGRQGDLTRQNCQSPVQEGNCNWTALWRPA